MSWGVGRRHGSEPALLWMGHGPLGVAVIQHLDWELAHAMGATLKIYIYIYFYMALPFL